MPYYSQIGPVTFDKKIFKKFSLDIHQKNWLCLFSRGQYNLSSLGRRSPKDLLCQIKFKSTQDKKIFKVSHIHRKNWPSPLVAIFSKDHKNLNKLGRGSLKDHLSQNIFTSSQ